MKDREKFEQVTALQELLIERQKDDPLRQFEPHEKQKPLINAVLEEGCQRVGMFAANRTGKSDAGAYIGSHLARFGPADPKPLPHAGATIQVKDRATSGWVISLDFPSSQQVIQPKYFDNGLCPPGSHKPFIPFREYGKDGWKAQDQILKLKNGSLIGFKSCESKATKFAGAGKDWIHIDEECPYEHYEEAVIRIEAGRKLIIFITATLLPPIGQVGGVSWMYQKIIKPFQDGNKDWNLFGAAIYDNPYLDRAEIAIQEAMFPEGSPQRRIRLDGEWLPGIGGALAYPAFHRKIHVTPYLPDVDPRLPISWMWDFNVEPLITLVGQKNMDGPFRIYKELVMDEGNIPDMCQLFYENMPEHRAEVWIYGDATGTHRNAQYGQNDYTVILNHMRKYGLPLRLKLPGNQKNPFVADRLNAVNRCLKNEVGRSMLEVDPSCKELIDDMEGVLIDPRGGIKKSVNKKEIYYRRTHSSDALGYWISYEAPVKSIIQPRRRIVRVKDPTYATNRV